MCVYKGRPGTPQSPWACSFPVAGWWSGRVLSAGRLVTTGQFTEDLRAGGRCVNWAQRGSSGADRRADLLLRLEQFQATSSGLVFLLCGWRWRWMSVFGTWPLLIEWWWWFLRLLRGQPRSSLFLLVPTTHSPSLGLSCSVICVHVISGLFWFFPP